MSVYQHRSSELLDVVGMRLTRMSQNLVVPLALEIHSTDRTTPLLPGLAHVPLRHSLSLATHVAEPALGGAAQTTIPTDAHLQQQVDEPLTWALEGSTARRARVLWLVVSTAVGVQRWTTPEPLSTHVTHKGPLSCVHVHVDLHLVSVLEPLSTNVTRYVLRPSNATSMMFCHGDWRCKSDEDGTNSAGDLLHYFSLA